MSCKRCNAREGKSEYFRWDALPMFTDKKISVVATEHGPRLLLEILAGPLYSRVKSIVPGGSVHYYF